LLTAPLIGLADEALDWMRLAPTGATVPYWRGNIAQAREELPGVGELAEAMLVGFLTNCVALSHRRMGERVNDQSPYLYTARRLCGKLPLGLHDGTLTPIQWRVIDLIREKPSTVGGISIWRWVERRLSIPEDLAREVVDNLLERELIAKKANYPTEITEKGRKLCTVIHSRGTT